MTVGDLRDLECDLCRDIADFRQRRIDAPECEILVADPVSYTQLTPPTSGLVQTPEVPVYVKQKNRKQYR